MISINRLEFKVCISIITIFPYQGYFAIRYLNISTGIPNNFFYGSDGFVLFKTLYKLLYWNNHWNIIIYIYFLITIHFLTTWILYAQWNMLS